MTGSVLFDAMLRLFGEDARGAGILAVHLLAFAVPLAATTISFFAAGGIGIAAAVIAVIAQAPGMLAERWLFFAEARHAVTLYYGR
jgi:DMSO reductase anchor subunit